MTHVDVACDKLSKSNDVRKLALWHITYKNDPLTLDPLTEAYRGRGHDGYGSWSRTGGGAGQRCISLDAIGHRRRRDGDDRQLSIRLDILRPRHPEEIRMGS